MFRQLYTRLAQKKAHWSNEAELRLDWVSEFSSALNIRLHAEVDYLDSNYNNVIIEFKKPGSFKGRSTSQAFKEAIYRRLEPYIKNKARAEDIDPSNYIGIAIDGAHICFAQIVDDRIEHDELLPFSLEAVSMVAIALQDAFRRTLTLDNLIEDFGQSSSSAISLMQALIDILAVYIHQETNNKIKMLFAEWRTLYGQVADLSVNQINGIRKSIGFNIPVYLAKESQIPACLFVIHTYNSLLIKLIAAEIVAAHGLTSRRAFSQIVSTYPDDDLLRTLDDQIEKGRLYEAAGINGFVEEAIFSWYIDACDNSTTKQAILSSIKEILMKLSFYRTNKLGDAQTQDILKGFYQTLVPNELRKSLGEFYTPDWLVDFTINKLDNPDWLKHRFLDPTCGSGSFLIALVRRIREKAEYAGLSPQDITQLICKNVWGFDLNPLAVQTGRVNLLIAIADLLKAYPGQKIELPILMADSIYSPAPDPAENEKKIVKYTIGSDIADLKVEIPYELAIDRHKLDTIFDIMSQEVENEAEFENALIRLEKANIITKNESLDWQIPLRKTYKRIFDLHQKDWNGIWFRIVRNFFWSSTAGKFDYIIGNPPWVRWSKLPELYRERVMGVCKKYDIFSNTPHHGGNELDISGMITYTVADKWLKEGGQIAFIITQTHFQSASSEGFRSFKINQSDRLIPLSVDDMKELRPFADAVNKTSVTLFVKKKEVEPHYPVKYRIWTAKKGTNKVIPSQLQLNDVLKRLHYENMEATPVNGGNTPWAILPPGRFQTMRRILGESKWVNGRKGITTDLNGIYFVNIVNVNTEIRKIQIETRPEAGKKDIGPKQRYWIEPDLLYPLLKGASDISDCRIIQKNDLYVLIPNSGITNEVYQQALELFDQEYPDTLNYLKDFESLLLKRATYRRYLKGKPFWAIYNIGSYTFAPYKIVWAEQSNRFTAAVVTAKHVPVVGIRPYIPDHKVFFVPMYNKDAAFYLCGLLSSNLVKEFIMSHNISIQTGDVFKHMNLPRYNPMNDSHRKLALLTEQAHQISENSKLIDEIKILADTMI